jgi:O-antigen/teichoic acid export membrane protein
MVVSFAVLWAGFALGWGVYSLLAVSVVSLLVGTSATFIACRRLGFYPSPANRGRYDSAIFKELFRFGSGLFLMNLGTLMASASQVILVSRLMGVESAAIWAIATKLFTMAQQFVAKILESSAGGLTEMLVRGDLTGMRKRFRDIVTVSAVLAVFLSAAIALLNGAFVELWTSGKITWNPWNNLLLGCVLFSTAVIRCHTGLVGITKQIRGMKYINLLEGAVFIILSLFLVPVLGMAGLLVGTLVCNAGVAGIYGISRTAQYFGVRKREVILWIYRPIAVLGIVALAFSFGQWFSLETYEVQNRFLVGAAIFTIVITPCIWIFAMDLRLRMEIAKGGKLVFAKVRQSLRLA